MHASAAVVRGSLLFAIPWTALERGASTRTAAWLGALAMAGYFLTAVPAGRRADTGSRRRLIRVAMGLSLATLAVCTPWQAVSPVPVPVLGLALLTLGAGGGILLGASYPAAEDLVHPAGLRGAHAQLNTLDQLMVFGFTAVGAALLQILTFDRLLLVLSAIASTATVAALAMDDPLDGRQPSAGGRTRRTRSSLRSTLTRPGHIRTLLWLGFAWNLAVAGFGALLVPWLHSRLGLSAGEAAAVLGASAAGPLLSGVLLSYGRVRRPALSLLGMALGTQAVCLTALVAVPARAMVPAAAVLALTMLANSSAASLFTTARAELSRPEERGAVLATGQVVHRVGYLVSSLAAGAVVPLTGFAPLFLMCAAGTAAVALTLRTRRLPG